MEISKKMEMKLYTTNYLLSVAFYFAWLCPIIMIVLSIPIAKDFKNSWPALIVFYPIAFLLEFLAIKHIRKHITIDDAGITIKNSNYIQTARWEDVVELKEYLFGQGELFYELITKDRKKIGFTSSIKNCGDLLKEIEQRTGLKFKQKL